MDKKITDSNPSQTSNRSSATDGILQRSGLNAAALIVRYFAHWINFLGIEIAGFDLILKRGVTSLLLWSIPVIGAVALIAPINKLLDFGSYIGLCTAPAILILAPRAK